MTKRITVLLAFLIGCSSPDAEPEGSCGPNGACPAKYECSVEGRCVLIGGQMPFDAALAPDATPDARADAAVDAPIALGAPDLVVDRDAWDYGAVVVGQSGASVSFTVTNRGTAAAPPLAPLVTGGRSASFLVDEQSSCAGAALAPGATCSVGVTFRPDVAGTIAAVLEAGTVHVTLGGQGLAPGELAISPSGADLGGVVVGGRSAPAVFKLTNRGGARTAPLVVVLGGSGAGAYALDADGCSGKSLEPAASCDVGVVLTPRATGIHGASLSASASPGGAQTAMLTGRGLAAAALHIEPPALDLGTSVLGGTAGGTFTVVNDGDVATGALATALAGAPEITVTSDGCAGMSLGAGRSCTITVIAHPAVAGSLTTTLTVTSATPVLTAQASATTTAVAPGALKLSPASATFAPAVIGSAGESRTFTVKNSGGLDTGALATTLSGSGRAEFAVSHDTCAGSSLAPDATCSLSVQFKPGARQTQGASLVVSAASGGAATSSLSGIGLAPAALEGDAATFAFGTVDVGQMALAQTLTIANRGDVVSATLSTTVTGDVAELLLDDHCAKAPLEPGATCTIAVTFAPLSGGMKSITVAVAAGDAAGVELMAQGSGRPPVALTVDTDGAGTVSSQPAGIACGATCTAGYVHGTTVTLSATPATGSFFAGWTGACTGTGPCVVAMTETRNVVATFSLQPIALHVATSGSGSVGSAPTGIDCGATCDHSFDWGTEVTLTARPASGWSASAWTGCPGASGATCVISLKDAASVTATFAPLPIPVTVTVTGAGGVASQPAGLDCVAGGASCSSSFPFGQPLVLTATPQPNHHLVTWSGACGGAAATCPLTPGLGALSVGAAFAIDTHPLTVTNAGGGTVTSAPAGVSCGATCGASFDHGTSVVLTAEAAGGYRFTGWGGACGGAGTCKVTMDQARDVTATFVKQVSLNWSTGTGGGTLTPSPAGTSCGPTCATYDLGTDVTLTAASTSGGSVGAWGGDCAATATGAASCALKLSVAANASVAFLQTITVSPAPVDGTVSGAGLSCPGGACSVSVAYGASVTLSATAGAHHHLGAWSGDCPGGVCSMTANRTTSASFPADTTALTVTSVGGGSVTSSPSGINCGATCEASYDYDLRVTLTAGTPSGYRFVGWSGACTATSGTCEVKMDQARAVTATFAKQVQLNWSTGMGGGTLTPSPAPVSSCGATCAMYDVDTPVTLTAAPTSGGSVGAWSGACSTTAAGASSCGFKMNAAQSAGVVFLQTLTVNPAPSHGKITGSGLSCPGGVCTVTATYGTKLTVAAENEDHYHFTGWTGDCSSGSCEMTGNHTVGATFAIDRFTLKITNGTGGSIASSPSGISCGATCEATYDYGKDVTLTATPSTGYRFLAFGGDCTGKFCTVTMTQDRAVSASWMGQVQLQKALVNNGGGSLNWSPSEFASCGTNCGVFDVGTDVTLTASTGGSGTIGSWGDDCALTAAGASTCTLKMDKNKKASVGFMYTLTVTAGTGGTVTPACASGCSYVYGTTVNVSASPAANWQFWKWTSNQVVTGGANGQVLVNTNVTAQAQFYVQQVSLFNNGISQYGTVTITGKAGSTSETPSNSVTYTCNGNVGGCPAAWAFDLGSSVKITATPTPTSPSLCPNGCLLKNWTGRIGESPNTQAPVPKVLFISNVGTTSQGINWNVSGSCGQPPLTYLPYFYGGCTRADKSIPYNLGYTAIGATFAGVIF